MRLYPPAWMMPRAAIEDDEIDGLRIPAKSEILLFTYLTHRDPKFWENPETFDPERFSPENSQNRHKFAYFPFGGGARQCIGKNLALMEAQLIIPMVLQKFRLRLVPNHPVEAEPSLTLRPRYGLKMILQPV
jgi:cytochrome P450